MHVMPELKRLEAEFGGDLSVIGVHSAKFDNERDTENIRNAVLRYGIQHPVVNDADFQIWNAFEVRAWPTLLLLNPLGEVDRVYSGEGHYQDLREDILRLKKDFAGKIRSDPLPISLESAKAPPSLLNFPGKLAYAPELNRIYVADSGHHRILGFDPNGEVMTVIGAGEEGMQDGGFSEARFRRPQGLAYRDRKLYVADTENHLLREVDLSVGRVTTLAGVGKQGFERSPKRAPALKTALASPWDLAFSPDGQSLVIAMAGTHQLWIYDLSEKTLSVLAGNGREFIDDGIYPDNSLSQPSGLSVLGDQLFFVDSETSSLRRINFADGSLKTLIGRGLFDFGFKDGKRSEAKLQHPLGLWAEESGIYVADAYNHAIRRFDAKSGVLSTLVGDGKRGSEDGSFVKTRFNEPNAIIRVGDQFFVADTNNHAIRVLDPATQQTSTLILKMPTVPAAEKPSEKLPNLKTRENLVLKSGLPIAWTLSLPEGWKLNAQAPSSLSLYEGNSGTETLLKSYSKEELARKSLNFPALQTGKRYLLQGTFYYCREGREALCFLQSLQSEISVSPDGEGSFEWKVKPDAEP